jgi:hypothetical protein
LTARNPGVSTLDLSDSFCDAQLCYGVAGNLIVYRDNNHISWQYADTLPQPFWNAFRKTTGLGG